MHRSLILAVAALSAAAVLALAVRGQLDERTALFEDFTRTQQGLAREVASDLDRALAEVDEDGRVVAGMVTRARGEAAGPDEANPAVLAAFRALAAVVRYYRCVALFRPGADLVSAVDPSEPPATARWLLERSAEAARTAESRGRTSLVGPEQSAEGRYFFFHASVDRPGETVVLVADARLLLQSVLRPRAGQVRYALLDPTEALWLGCSQPTTCRAHVPADWRRNPAFVELVATLKEAPRVAWPTGPLARTLRLPLRPLVVVSERVRGGPGDWSLAVVASAAALDARERTLLTRLLLTSVGLVVSIGGLGLVFARQQRRAAALEERLRHDQERRALEEQIARAEKLLTVGVLAAGIAHEIGTPLAIIRGRAEAQLEKVSDAPTVTALKAIVEQIDRISSTIRQVLDFAHRQPVAVRPTDARAAASRALAMLDWRFRRKEVTARLDVEADVPQIAADPDQLQQTLLNLLLNSCDACARGGTVRIRIGGDVAVPGTVRIAIEDDGCGIAPENIQAVFDPFFTTKGRGEGTGLGLFVASNIVRRHGGRIRLESDPGKGTTAIIDWPIAAGSAGGA